MTAPPEGDVIDHLVARLRHKRLLIVVDNCEHVLAAAADAVERIVAQLSDRRGAGNEPRTVDGPR